MPTLVYFSQLSESAVTRLVTLLRYYRHVEHNIVSTLVYAHHSKTEFTNLFANYWLPSATISLNINGYDSPFSLNYSSGRLSRRGSNQQTVMKMNWLLRATIWRDAVWGLILCGYYRIYDAFFITRIVTLHVLPLVWFQHQIVLPMMRLPFPPPHESIHLHNFERWTITGGELSVSSTILR